MNIEHAKRIELLALAVASGVVPTCHDHTTCIRIAFARAGKADIIPEDLK